MTLMPHSIFEHYPRAGISGLPRGRTSRDAVIRPDVRCGSRLCENSGVHVFTQPRSKPEKLERTSPRYFGRSVSCQDRTHASQHDLIMMRDYEPQSDAATRRMLASAADMAAALSFGCVFVVTIVSALLSRLS